MEQLLLVLVGGAYLLAPIALAVALARQGRARQALEEEVRRLGLRLEALARNVSDIRRHGGDAPEATGPTAPPAPAPPVPTRATSAPPPEPRPASATSPPPFGPVLDTSPVPPPLPPAPPRPAPPPLAPPPPAPAIDWEALVGVRLFSWIAGVALLVAGVFFLRWSMEHGWLGPAARAAIGAAVGVGLLVGAETGRARRYAVTAQSLAAAGAALLFATVFAAHALYHLLPALAAFPLLVLVAAVAVAYAVRRRSLPMALLGLVGGFATPILLSTGEDRPISLFGYLLMLDAALAWVAWKRRWPLLSAVAAALTALYQLGWVGRFLGTGNAVVALGIFLVFPLFGFASYALARRGAAGDPPDAVSRWTMALGAVPPVLFLLHAARSAAYAGRPGLLLGFAALLCAGLLVVAARQGPEWLHLLGAGAAVLTAWTFLDEGAVVDGWPVATVAPLAALAAVLLAGPGLLARRGWPLRAEGRWGLLGAPLLLLALTALPAAAPVDAEPLLLAGLPLAIAAGAAWIAVRGRNGVLLAATGAASPWVLMAVALRGGGAPLAVLAAAVLLGATALLALRALEAGGERDPGPWLTTGVAALLVAAQVAAAAVAARNAASWFPVQVVTQVLLLAGLLAVAARTGRHAVALVAAVTASLGAVAVAVDGGSARALSVVAPLWALQVAAPLLALRRGDRSRLLLWAAAAASALALPLHRHALHRLDLAWLVGPVVLLQALALVPHLVVLVRGGLEAERSRVVVTAGTILALVTAAIPLQLDREWITVGWALLALALAWLQARLPHRGLLAWIGALAVAVVARLALNPEVLAYHPRSGALVWNFWLYAYGLPALSLLGAARLLPEGADRVLPGWPRLRPVLAAMGGLLLFLLLNVEIADAFSSGTRVALRLTGSLAYDLALTIGWALFAIALLGVGVALVNRPARITAIALLAVTVLKGFLLDLGQLTGLYRVGSFVGLALSLALVAVILQRFVLADRGGSRGSP